MMNTFTYYMIVNLYLNHKILWQIAAAEYLPLWNPDNTTFESFIDCAGIPCDEFKKTSKLVTNIRRMMAMATPGMSMDQAAINELNDFNQTIDGCIYLSPQQASAIFANLQKDLSYLSNQTHVRKKRKVLNFRQIPYAKWPDAAIIYKFDGRHDTIEQNKIRKAIQHWEAKTCIRFKEVYANENINTNHLIFTKGRSGCHSYVGMIHWWPQVINLQTACIWKFGTIVHEIGHSLGLWHEQMRYDRDNHIYILRENLGKYKAQFIKLYHTVGLGVPYDYSSVMHYSPKDGSSNGNDVIRAVDPLFQKNMGQRTGLSFYDAKIINMAYCTNRCSWQLQRQCMNSGYQDPNNCQQCICPDGFSGQFCEYVQNSHGECQGGDYYINSYDAHLIKSPGYDYPQYYNNFQECNWLLRAPDNYVIKLRFEGSFGIYSHIQGECYHWLEIRYKTDLGENGPRMCGLTRPTSEITSLTNKVLLVFRSSWTSASLLARRGFKLYAYTEPKQNYRPAAPRQTPRPAPTQAPRPQPTTTTTTSTTTTTTTTTTTRRIPIDNKNQNVDKSGRNKHTNLFINGWSCDFENNNLCGIEQVGYDEFDWTLTYQATPSHETGPDYAAQGRYYIFIEASNPRIKQDRAIILLPQTEKVGWHCVHFYYHMYGFHVGRLELFTKSIRTNQDRYSHQQSSLKWYKVGNHKRIYDSHKLWYEENVNVHVNDNERIGFNGIRGEEFSGDIALDVISIREGNC